MRITNGAGSIDRRHATPSWCRLPRSLCGQPVASKSLEGKRADKADVAGVMSMVTGGVDRNWCWQMQPAWTACHVINIDHKKAQEF